MYVAWRWILVHYTFFRGSRGYSGTKRIVTVELGGLGSFLCPARCTQTSPLCQTYHNASMLSTIDLDTTTAEAYFLADQQADSRQQRSPSPPVEPAERAPLDLHTQHI